MKTEMKLNPNRPLMELARMAEGPDDITDAVAFVHGFVEAEIKERMGKAFEANDTATHAAYEARLNQLSITWECFLDHTPTGKPMGNPSAQTNGRVAHVIAASRKGPSGVRKPSRT